MGVRAWVAAGVMAAGLWAGQASAAVYTVDLSAAFGDTDFAPVTIHPGDTLTVTLNITTPGPTYDPADYYYYYIFGNATLSGHLADGSPYYVGGSNPFGPPPIQGKFNNYMGAPRNFILAGGSGNYDIFTGLSSISASVVYTGPRFLDDGITFDHIGGGAYVYAQAAPEPGTWALMLAGFAGLGVLRWRRVSTS